jgi:hypothetical protein
MVRLELQYLREIDRIIVAHAALRPAAYRS